MSTWRTKLVTLAHPPKPNPTIRTQTTTKAFKTYIAVQLGMKNGGFSAAFYKKNPKQKSRTIDERKGKRVCLCGYCRVVMDKIQSFVDPWEGGRYDCDLSYSDSHFRLMLGRESLLHSYFCIPDYDSYLFLSLIFLPNYLFSNFFFLPSTVIIYARFGKKGKRFLVKLLILT